MRSLKDAVLGIDSVRSGATLLDQPQNTDRRGEHTLEQTFTTRSSCVPDESSTPYCTSLYIVPLQKL